MAKGSPGLWWITSMIPLGLQPPERFLFEDFHVGKTMSCLPSPSHHHFYRWYKLFPVTGGKNDIVLPTLCHIQLVLGLSTTINHYQPILTTTSNQKWLEDFQFQVTPSKVQRTESMASLWWTCRPLVSFGRLRAPAMGKSPQQLEVHHETMGIFNHFFWI